MDQTTFFQAMKRPLQNNRGAYTEELAVVVAAVVGAAMVMSGYFRDSVAGMVRWTEILCNTLVGGV